MADCWRELNEAPAPPDAYYEEVFRSQAAGSRRVWWVISGGDKVGLVNIELAPHWYESGTLTGKISEFYIQPERRRQGLGTALARQVLDFLREQGAKRLEVFVPVHNRPALFFWQALGFSVDAYHLSGRSDAVPCAAESQEGAGRG